MKSWLALGTAAMVAAGLTGCSGSKEAPATEAPKTEAATEAAADKTEAAAETTEEKKELEGELEIVTNANEQTYNAVNEILEQFMKENPGVKISYTTQGSDYEQLMKARMASNDLPDIFVTDMLPGTDRRLKTKTTFDNWDRYRYNLENGYWHQFTRNMFQINNGDGTFSDVGRLAGVEATDWSWGALFMDMDNDGLKDIFVANGIYQDLTDQDYVSFIADERTK